MRVDPNVVAPVTFNVPDTSNVLAGEAVPIPTLILPLPEFKIFTFLFTLENQSTLNSALSTLCQTFEVAPLDNLICPYVPVESLICNGERGDTVPIPR